MVTGKYTKVLTYDPDIYTPKGVKFFLTPAEARKEYKRLRSLALKRLKNFEGTEYTDTQIYRQNKKAYLKPPSQLTDRQIATKLAQIARYVTSGYSTVARIKKIRSKSLATLHRHGYKISADEYSDFGKFMEKAKAYYTAKTFDSIRAAEMYQDKDSDETLDELVNKFNNEKVAEAKAREELAKVFD